MPCPDCGCWLGEFRFGHSAETHGLDSEPDETLYEEFVMCRRCDGRSDPAEWSAAELNMDLDSDFAAGIPDEAMIQVTIDAEDHAASGA